jgi:4-carboxymuconolactone decarboxylase
MAKDMTKDDTKARANAKAKGARTDGAPATDGRSLRGKLETRTNKRVSRMPPLPDPLPSEVQALFADRMRRTGRVLNVHHTFAHAPRLSRASADMAMGLRFETSVPRRDIELAIVRAAQLAKGEYELQQHKPMLLAENFSEKQYAALHKWRKHKKLFDKKDKALLAYADEVADYGDVSNKTYKGMQKHYTPQQIMELTFAIGSYYGTALVMNAMKIKLEKTH